MEEEEEEGEQEVEGDIMVVVVVVGPFRRGAMSRKIFGKRAEEKKRKLDAFYSLPDKTIILHLLIYPFLSKVFLLSLFQQSPL